MHCSRGYLQEKCMMWSDSEQKKQWAWISPQLFHWLKTSIKQSLHGIRKLGMPSNLSLELPRFRYSDLCERFAWAILESMQVVVLGEKEWRTWTRWILAEETLPVIFTAKITSLSLVSSDHQDCGTPSMMSSRVCFSSWRTETSAIWPGLITPVAGVTYWTKEL